MPMHTHMQCPARTPHAPRSTCMHIVCVGGGLVGTVQVQSRLGHSTPPRVFHPHGGQSGGWPPTLSSHVVSVYAGFVTWGDMVWPWPALWRGWTVPTARVTHTHHTAVWSMGNSFTDEVSSDARAQTTHKHAHIHAIADTWGWRVHVAHARVCGTSSLKASTAAPYLTPRSSPRCYARKHTHTETLQKSPGPSQERGHDACYTHAANEHSHARVPHKP